MAKLCHFPGVYVEQETDFSGPRFLYYKDHNAQLMGL